jgi:hypothetical protein
VCLGDLHWASPATLGARCGALPRDLKRHPVGWLLARSSTPQRDADYLAGLLEKDGATRVTVAPLAQDAVAVMLADAFGAPASPHASSSPASSSSRLDAAKTPHARRPGYDLGRIRWHIRSPGTR